jgi:hypothetical protein
MNYHPRTVDLELDRLTDGGIAAIAIEGAKAIGKSATASERATRIFPLEDPATRELLEADPSRLLEADRVLIDEWQRMPSAWDVVRRAVDAGARPGQFLLTGSASAIDPGTHSGAGRIVTLRMRPMTLPERDIEVPTVSLAELLGGAHPQIRGTTAVDLDDYVAEICRSGFPGIRAVANEASLRALLSGYIDRVIDRDIADATGRMTRNQPALRRWLNAYAAATSTTAAYDTIRDAATAGEADKPAKTTAITYRDALEALYILDPVPAWISSANHISELASSPKHQLVDPALAVSALGLSPAALIEGETGAPLLVRDGTLLGALFESLVTLSTRVFAQAAEASVAHLRTQRGRHEVDLIIERSDRRIVALEVKLSASIGDDDVKHLRWLSDTIGSNLLDAVVITTGSDAYRRKDGVAVIPLALFGP